MAGAVEEPHREPADSHSQSGQSLSSQVCSHEAVSAFHGCGRQHHAATGAEQSVEQAEEADAALTSITQAVSIITDMNTQIASAAEQQSAVAEDINRNVTTIDSVAKSVASGAREASDASASLTKLAEQQRRLINQFRV